MGQITDAKIAAWQEASGIEPARGERLAACDALQELAFDLIKAVELEKSGICDGDGHWYGSDVLHSMVRSLGEMYERLVRRDGHESDGAASWGARECAENEIPF
jgi:hypothetical protein